MADFSIKTDAQINQWIANYEKARKTSDPFYFDLLAERARRGEERSGLRIERSLAVLVQAAVQGVCTTYGELAEASGVDWVKARMRMNGQGGHLDQLLETCHARGLPLLTAICVNKGNVGIGELEPVALQGFVECARRLGYRVTDAASFHQEHRDACWAWGRSQGERRGPDA